MSTYNKIYKENDNAWGEAIEPLVLKAAELKTKGNCLEIGCGQGKDSLFLAQKGFNVTAIDGSSEGIKQLSIKVEENKLDNLKAKNEKAEDIEIEDKYYDIIICLHVLQFLEKEKAIQLIHDIKSKIKEDGIVVLASFITKDPTFQDKSKTIIKTHFNDNEIKDLFCDFDIIEHFEGVIEDKGHAGSEQPHEHGIVNIIARKR